MRALVSEIVNLLERGLTCVCCTVVATRGSTPQKAGAIMLVLPDGTQSGTLGGGCVEAEVRRRALASIASESNTPAIHTFMLDDDYGWDDGLICGGRMTIVAETLTPDSLCYYRVVHSLLNEGRAFTEVVALPDNRLGWPVGSRTLFDDANQAIATSTGMLSLSDVSDVISHLDAVGVNQPMVINDFALLPIQPRIRLLIVGAGHVGQAVARLARDTDFDVSVLDDREKFADENRFPEGTRCIVGDIGRELQSLKQSIGPSTYCLIVTRGHSHDEEALFHLATTPAGYVGMIGSKRKKQLIFDDLLAKGISEDALAKVKSPIGLPIGSQTVPEIAISIVAELIARRNLR